jgi:hypothetical protein
MNKLFVVALLSLILTSGCAKQMDCKAKPDPQVTIDSDINIEVTPGARIACEF